MLEGVRVAGGRVDEGVSRGTEMSQTKVEFSRWTWTPITTVCRRSERDWLQSAGGALALRPKSMLSVPVEHCGTR